MHIQKWEYCEAELTIGGPITSGFVVNFFNETPKNNKWTGGYADGMTKLGKLGWELVASSARTGTGMMSSHKINMVFKRPLEDEPEKSA